MTATAILVLATALGSPPLPDNDWFGLRSGPTTGVLAKCEQTRSGSVWAAVTGSASLDIIQVGARNGRFFAAWGAGDPNGPGSAYTERDLGPAAGTHKYTVQLLAGAYSLSVDGVTQLRVPVPVWTVSAAQVAYETETAAEPFGGARCVAARVFSGRWVTPQWSAFGYGAKAAAATTTQGPDWFAVAA